MKIFAIGDLHLSHARPKPMDIFGPHWANHTGKIYEGWKSVVGEDDLVIIPGDISWAMHLKEAEQDLDWLARLPGRKLLVRGNHDYWWSSIGKVRSALPPGIFALQNDHYTWDDLAVCGTRGWICPGDEGFENGKDEKIYQRELLRLKMSLDSAIKDGCEEIIAALHFPPFNRFNQPGGFTELLEEYRVKVCVFAHIHDSIRDTIFQGRRNSVCYYYAAADGIDFTPLEIYP